MKTESVIRTRSICPRCKNTVAMRINESGVTFPIHRISRNTSEVCK